MIHREGYTIILSTLIICAAGTFLVYQFLPAGKLYGYLLYSLLFVVLILVVQFFRNPGRQTPVDPRHIISPADGKVVILEEVEEPEYFIGKRLQISVFMSPLNVHVNRSPVTGTVRYYRYHPGDYLVAWHPKSSTLNERTTVVVETDKGELVLFRQIAGALARRIVCYIKEGNRVTQGGEYGFIKFGSRVDVFLPPGTPARVKPGDVVRGGESILAEWP
ncbi:MAG: phosphatidylserine decarboxylase family protein [Sphingomonadales bacterium]|nr:phosphatidylserine decarboxylase family protein [Sphingomonadales bacterium]